jgi:hypothetical protein
MALNAAPSSANQARHVVVACYLGWTLDAFDFFIMVFVLGDIANPDYARLLPILRNQLKDMDFSRIRHFPHLSQQTT